MLGQAASLNVVHVSTGAGRAYAHSVPAAVIDVAAQGHRVNALDGGAQPAAVQLFAPVGENDFGGGGERRARGGRFRGRRLHDLRFTTCTRTCANLKSPPACDPPGATPLSLAKH